MENFGLKLKRLREKRGLSFEELAKECKVNILILRDWERDSMVLTIYRLIRLAQYFDVSIDYLVGL